MILTVFFGNCFPAKARRPSPKGKLHNGRLPLQGFEKYRRQGCLLLWQHDDFWIASLGTGVCNLLAGEEDQLPLQKEDREQHHTIGFRQKGDDPGHSPDDSTGCCLHWADSTGMPKRRLLPHGRRPAHLRRKPMAGQRDTRSGKASRPAPGSMTGTKARQHCQSSTWPKASNHASNESQSKPGTTMVDPEPCQEL